MSAPYRRLLELDGERAEGAPRGVVRGVLATDGEASDGHVLSIEGGVVQPGIPLLFGHDTFSGDRHLGSWVAFRRSLASTPKRIVGEAEIELEGAGANRDFREDVATLVEKGRMRGLSVQWEATAPPVARVNLPSDHPAFVDADQARGTAKRWGLFFGHWRALEGSIVSIGADRGALIERAASGTPFADLIRSEVAASERRELEIEHEIEARIASLELFAEPGAVPAVRSRPAPGVSPSLESVDVFLARIYAKAVERELGASFAEEVALEAQKRIERITGVSKR